MEQSLNGAVNYRNKRVAFRSGVTRRNFGDLVGGDTTGRQTPTGYRELDFDLKGKIILSPSSDLTGAYQSVHQSDVPVCFPVGDGQPLAVRVMSIAHFLNSLN